MLPIATLLMISVVALILYNYLTPLRLMQMVTSLPLSLANRRIIQAHHPVFVSGAAITVITSVFLVLGLLIPAFASFVFLGYSGLSIITFLIAPYIVGIAMMLADANGSS